MSPLPEVYDDAKGNISNEDLDAMNRIIDNLFWKLTDDEQDAKKDLFWNEHHQFHSKEGPFSQRFIWNSRHVVNQDSHLWHHQYLYPQTEVFGKVHVS